MAFMSSFFLFFSQILHSLLVTVLSENINCQSYNHLDYCGPCQNAEDCQLSCIGYEACKGPDHTFQCTKDQNCDIICDGGVDGASCLEATIRAETANAVTVNCTSFEDCKDLTLYAGTSHLTVNCMTSADGMNCVDMVIYAELSSSVVVNCDGFGSCKKLAVNCGTGDCIVHCNDNQGDVCEDLTMECGDGHCQIECQGYNKCETVNIDTSRATSFLCNGSNYECRYAPSPFTNSPTPSPTGSFIESSTVTTSSTSPTIQSSGNVMTSTMTTQRPQSTPSTLSRSTAPSISPSTAPSRSPPSSSSSNISVTESPSPSIHPTPSPIKMTPTSHESPGSPHEHTTRSPSDHPTEEPTFLPTEEPTHFPSVLPSQSPTVYLRHHDGRIDYDTTLSPTMVTNLQSVVPRADAQSILYDGAQLWQYVVVAAALLLCCCSGTVTLTLCELLCY